jgi:hypothetical protein
MEKKRFDKVKYWLAGLGIVTVTLVFIMAGCNKSDGVCLSNSGPVIMEERDMPDFDSIYVRNYVNVILKQDTVNKVTVEAGKNIISGITTEVENRMLILDNKNTCNWLRNYNKPINVHVSVRNLWKIQYFGSGNITSADTIRSDSLKIDTWGGCGTIDLMLNIGRGYVVLQMGTVDIRLHGICPLLSVYSGDYGAIRCDDLRSAYCYVDNRGTNDCYVYSWHYFSARIESIGNIYYTGNPDTVITVINGPGQVIPF